ncbi:MAG TPA: ABC transporter ATP-binding protein [Gammaproteobacteria bacterium]|nr:ABC transporter ATP-binding protein [Gammaproteobacteria bacterium]
MIDIERLSFGYDRRKPLFQNLNLRLEPGNVYGLLGLNGAGKSTLLKLMTGLLFADTGSLRSLGYAPAERKPGFLSQVFVLPEELNLPGVTIGEYIKTRAPFYADFKLDLLDRYLREFDLPRGNKLTKLSYGQKKKFLLSFGLACQSALLVMDEPTNGLDIPSKGQFRRLIAEALTPDRLFIISTHQVRDVESLIDPIVILHGGSVLFNHTIGEISARIRMAHTGTRPDPAADGLLHIEPAVGGFWSVWRDRNASDGSLDLEVLFNTIVSRPELGDSLFAAKGEAA